MRQLLLSSNIGMKRERFRYNALVILGLLFSIYAYSQEKIDYHHSLTKSLRYAQNQDKFVFAFIYADWSLPCRQMMDSTFVDSVLVKELNDNFINLKINAARNRTFTSEYEVRVFPTYMLINKYEDVFIRFSGFKTPQEIKTELDKTKSQNRYLRQDLDSIVLGMHPGNALATLDSVRFHRDDYSSKNLIKKYLDRRKDWSDSISMHLLKDNFSLDKKYLKYVSKHHKEFNQLFEDSLTLKENIAFNVFVNSLKPNVRGRPTFEFKPVKRWFRKYKLDDIEKMEDFVRIKYLLWGRGPSVTHSVNLIKNYPETSDENVLFASVVRLLISNTRRRLDYDDLIDSIIETLNDDSSFWRYDALSLLYYKMGEDQKADEAIVKARLRADAIDQDYEPTLPLIKDKIERE